MSVCDCGLAWLWAFLKKCHQADGILYAVLLSAAVSPILPNMEGSSLWNTLIYSYNDVACTWLSAHHSCTFMSLPISCSHLVRHRSSTRGLTFSCTSRPLNAWCHCRASWQQAQYGYGAWEKVHTVALSRLPVMGSIVPTWRCWSRMGLWDLWAIRSCLDVVSGRRVR